MNKITTTAARVKQAGLWCSRGDTIAADALNRGSVPDWQTEFNISEALPLVGLANTILLLGAVRPRHRDRALEVLKRYQDYLVTEAEVLFAAPLNLERRLISIRRGDTPSPRAQALRVKWLESKLNASAYVKSIMGHDVILMLLSSYPLPLRIAYAARFNVAQYDDPVEALERSKSKLLEIIHDCEANL